MRIEFCLPVKNEESILKANTQRLASFVDCLGFEDWRVVVIVNGSNDSSDSIANSLVSGDQQRFGSVNYKKGGKGYALREYFKASQADILVFMDIDLAVDLAGLSQLVQPILTNNADLVIGSRLLPESRTSRSAWRSLTSQIYNYLSRVILDHKFSDLQCGFKAMRRSAYGLVEPSLRDEKWFFDTELVVISKKLDLRIFEIPVAWQENRYDERKSKVRVVRDVWSFIRNLAELRLRISQIKR